MEIKFIARSCFEIISKKGIIATDPYHEIPGLKNVDLKADIVTISHNHNDHNNSDAIKPAHKDKKPFVLSDPGEYEVSGIMIEGIASYHDDKKGAEHGRNTIFTFNIDGVKICHLGDLGHQLSDKQQDRIGEIDVLLIPVGGPASIEAEEAAKVIAQLEPKIAIPMHYKISEKEENLENVEKFLKEEGVNPEPIDFFSIDKNKLPEETKIIVLKPHAK